MTKISFNAHALGIARHDKGPNVGHAAACSTFQPVMVCRSGIEAIIEGLSFSNIEGFVAPTDKPLTGDVDT